MVLTSRVGLHLSECRRVEACLTYLNPKEPEAQGNWAERKVASLDLLVEVDNIQLERLLTRSQILFSWAGSSWKRHLPVRRSIQESGSRICGECLLRGKGRGCAVASCGLLRLDFDCRVVVGRDTVV